MNWQKLGLIIRPSDYKLKWWKTYGMDPSPLKLKDSIYRVFFCGRNLKNQSLIGSFDIDLSKPKKILNVSKKPLLGLGTLGAFDDNGVTASCPIRINNKKIFLYYIGWKPKSTTRYSLMTGLAISNNNGKTFKRYSKAPILKLTNREPYSILTAPYVLKVSNKKWLMWYVSCEEWVNENYPRYNIKLATSLNGIDWEQNGLVSIKLEKGERAIARPCVIKEKKIYKMWYCFETVVGKYRMGYAESKNGIKWTRKDKKILFPLGKKNEFDSDMTAYPYVVKYKNKKFMFYNGNLYGKDGIGLAIENKNK